MTEQNSESLISDFVKRRAQAEPQSFAVLAPERPPLTYKALDDFIVDFAVTLSNAGIKGGDIVAMALPNGPEAAVAFLTISTYATVAPLNPFYKQSEFDFYLSDLKATALVLPEGVDSPARDSATALGIPVIELRADEDGPCGLFTLAGSAGNKNLESKEISRAKPGDTALVLHTSGTTSRPKIVPLTHSNLAASAKNIASSLKLTERDRTLNVMPLFHVHGLIGSLLASLSVGASIAAMPGFDAERFFPWLKEFAPTWYTAVPTMHRTILALAGQNNIKPVHALRFIRSCSATLEPKLMASLEEFFDAPVVEAYGMTEASHQMCINPLPPLKRKPGSVGLASGAEVGIMNEEGALLPNGQSGEIVARGPGVTRGYANNPSANASAFTAGWFRTGDLGVIDEDGYVYITGRKKEMINRGGEKVAPREVDEILSSHPAVSETVAFALPHPTLGEEVAAICTLKKGFIASETELRGFASERLADFKVPARVLIVDSIPKGPTGKLKRIGLAADLKHLLEREKVTARTPYEAKISAIWAEVLNSTNTPGVLDNFFQAGGDSLGAVRVASRISAAFKVEAGPGMVFASPTISELSMNALARQAQIIGLAGFEAALDEVEKLTQEEAEEMSSHV